ncbi:MAG: hypothetical protein AAB333_04610 [Pseudomonadota bacterium]
MADLLSWPSPGPSPSASLASFWEIASPRTPLAFWELEQQVQLTAGKVADQILGHHLSQLHQDPDFVTGAITQVRASSPIALVYKGRKRLSVLLSGGTRVVVETPYFRPKPEKKPGRKRTRRGPKGVGRYPVLEAVGIRDGVSPATRSQLALYMVQAGSYQEAIVLLSERGLSVDPSTLSRVARCTAQADIRLREAALATARAVPIAPKGPLSGQRVRVSIDGGRVRTRQPWKGRKTAKGRHRFDTPWREPRVLVIDLLDQQGRSAPLRLPLYEVLLDDAEVTFALVLGYLRLLGAAQARVVEFIADGADWIWERAESLRQQAEIPVERWVEVIDFYHASEHLYATIEICRSLSVPQRQQLYEQLRHTLRTAPRGVTQLIDRLQQEVKTRRGKKMKSAIAYFEKHAQRMAYTHLDDQHLPVGSGAVESAVRRIINLRFKAPGTFWNETTVAGLMHLRAAFKAGRWEEMMARVLTHTFPPPAFEALRPEQYQTLIPLEPGEDPSPERELSKTA